MAKKSFGKILVTGGAGFIGSEVVRQAARLGHKLIVVDKLTYAGDLARLAAAQGKINFLKADIADASKILSIFKKEKPLAVIHCAAETHVDRSILSDAAFIRTNVCGTQVLLNAARTFGVQKFIQISTDEVYGEIARGKFSENSALSPNSPYAASKASADMLVKAYMRTYQFPALIVRPSNNYGPWQYPEKFIPVIVYKALKNERVPVYAKGLNMREWLHISDCAAAILAVLGKGQPGETYNVGSGAERKNIDLAKTILNILGRPESLITFIEDRPGHDLRYALDSKKIRNEIGWTPQISFDDGLSETVHWFKDNILWLEKKARYLRAYWKKIYKFKPSR